MKIGKTGRILLIISCTLFMLLGLWAYGATGESSGLFLFFIMLVLGAVNIYKLVTGSEN